MGPYYQEMVKAKENPGYEPAVGDLWLRYQRAKEFHSRRFERCLENWRYYLALDPELGLGQYSMKMIAWLKAQGREVATYNICKGYVDQIAGGIMQSPFDPEFFPVNDEASSLTEAAKNAMYSDKELCDWNSAYYELVRAGLVHQGAMKMTITDRYHKLGNIALEVCLPNHWVSDPVWVTVNTRDCRVCWEEVMLMPDQALEIYGNKMPLTNDAKDLEALMSNYMGRMVEYGRPNGATPFVNEEKSWGTGLKFINEYRMKREKYTSVVYHGPDGDMEIPDSLPDAQSKIDWLTQRFGQNWDPYAVEEIEDFRQVCMKETICPSLTWNGSICTAPSEIQIGQIPFWVWSADRVNGEPHGVIDLVKDSQNDVNTTNLTINHKLQIEGGGGGQFIDPAGFESPEEYEQYKLYRNDPSRSWTTAPGLMIRNGMVPARPILTGQFPAEVYKRLDHILNVMIPHTSKVVPATRGQTEQSGESGYLYNLKKIQSDQALYTIHYMLRQFWNQVYEGYMVQCATQYSLAGVQRKFTTSNGSHSTLFNEPVTLPDGSTGLRNDASMLRQIRHKVIISEVQQTPTKRMEDLGLMNEYLRSMGPAAANKPLMVGYLLSRMASLIDPLTKADKETLKELANEELECDYLALQLKKKQILKDIALLDNPQPLPQAAVPTQPGQPAPQGPEQGVQAIPQPQPAPQAQGV